MPSTIVGSLREGHARGTSGKLVALLLLFVIGAHGFRGALRTGVDLGFQPAFQFLFGGKFKRLLL